MKISLPVMPVGIGTGRGGEGIGLGGISPVSARVIGAFFDVLSKDRSVDVENSKVIVVGRAIVQRDYIFVVSVFVTAKNNTHNNALDLTVNNYNISVDRRERVCQAANACKRNVR